MHGERSAGGRVMNWASLGGLQWCRDLGMFAPLLLLSQGKQAQMSTLLSYPYHFFCITNLIGCRSESEQLPLHRTGGWIQITPGQIIKNALNDLWMGASPWVSCGWQCTPNSPHFSEGECFLELALSKSALPLSTSRWNTVNFYIALDSNQ